jgi:aarF domain-containing kinase
LPPRPPRPPPPAADYKWSLRGLGGAPLEAERAACHQRGADRLLWLCRANGGIYIKLGQHVGMLDHLLPAEYCGTMRAHLLDRCPESPWASVRATIEEDLGRPLAACFSEIDPRPVASASLAQVHAARDAATGRRLAVKVQHRGLRETSAVDLATIGAIVRVVRALAPSADYTWLVEEAEENLPRELDFLCEAANAERCAANLSSPASGVRGRVTVPRVDHARTTHRVLTMDFVEGAKVTDRAALAAMGAPPAAVARLISETFAQMIFRFGDVHADPHAANMLVARAPPGAPVGWQLVLLDHGLYRRLDDAFRLEYAHLWRSLIFADVEGITRSATAMNAGDAVPLFAGMLTQRPWERVRSAAGGGDRLRLRYTAAERGEIQDYAGQYAEQIGQLLARIPRQLLLLLKTNDCLRAVDAELGAGVGTYVITARECARALARARREERRGWGGAGAEALERARLEARLTALRLAAWLAPLPPPETEAAAAGSK